MKCLAHNPDRNTSRGLKTVLNPHSQDDALICAMLKAIQI
jgi:hypothetical protein